MGSYLYHHMQTLVVGACLDLHGILSLQRGSHLWLLCVITISSRSQLGSENVSYRPLASASPPPSEFGLDPIDCEEGPQL